MAAAGWISSNCKRYKHFSSSRGCCCPVVRRLRDSAVEHDRTVEATAWMLLKRYGVVFRDLLARESNLPKWRELQIAFRRLEARGEIRGGRFVDGFVGEQFALPESVELLRRLRREGRSGEPISVVSADPLNFQGILTPEKRVSPAIRQLVTVG